MDPIKLTINIEIDGRTHQILFSEKEDITRLAKKFVKSNHLNDELIESLADNIRAFIKSFKSRADNKAKFEQNFRTQSLNNEYGDQDGSMSQPQNPNDLTHEESIAEILAKDIEPELFENGAVLGDSEGFHQRTQFSRSFGSTIHFRQDRQSDHKVTDRFSRSQNPIDFDNFEDWDEPQIAPHPQRQAKSVANTHYVSSSLVVRNKNKNDLAGPSDKNHACENESKGMPINKVLSFGSQTFDQQDIQEEKIKILESVPTPSFPIKLDSEVNLNLAKDSSKPQKQPQQKKKKLTESQKQQIYERLFNLAQKKNKKECKKCPPEDHPNSNQKKGSSSVMCVEDLNAKFYYSQIQRQQQKAALIKEAKELIENRPDPEATFTPVINPITHLLTEVSSLESQGVRNSHRRLFDLSG